VDESGGAARLEDVSVLQRLDDVCVALQVAACALVIAARCMPVPHLQFIRFVYTFEISVYTLEVWGLGSDAPRPWRIRSFTTSGLYV